MGNRAAVVAANGLCPEPKIRGVDRVKAIPQIELAAELDRIKTRPGKQAGTRNLMAYLARR
jgi:hypothetical protein